ncbi:hypothetical protein RI065_00740 [Mycoplasmatota bacterium zrk1]
MAQGIFPGMTSYDIQAIREMQTDIENWIEYTRKTKKYLEEGFIKLENTDFSNKVPYSLTSLMKSHIIFCNTIIDELSRVKNSIISESISEIEIKLLWNIGTTASKFNNSYGTAYNDDFPWKEYGNPDFKIVENMYGEGRDFVVTLIDAQNMSEGLGRYMKTENGIKITGGDFKGAQISQGNNTQQKIVNNGSKEEKTESTFWKPLLVTILGGVIVAIIIYFIL